MKSVFIKSDPWRIRASVFLSNDRSRVHHHDLLHGGRLEGARTGFKDVLGRGRVRKKRGGLRGFVAEMPSLTTPPLK